MDCNVKFYVHFVLPTTEKSTCKCYAICKSRFISLSLLLYRQFSYNSITFYRFLYSLPSMQTDQSIQRMILFLAHWNEIFFFPMCFCFFFHLRFRLLLKSGTNDIFNVFEYTVRSIIVCTEQVWQNTRVNRTYLFFVEIYIGFLCYLIAVTIWAMAQEETKYWILYYSRVHTWTMNRTSRWIEWYSISLAVNERNEIRTSVRRDVNESSTSKKNKIQSFCILQIDFEPFEQILLKK